MLTGGRWLLALPFYANLVMLGIGALVYRRINAVVEGGTRSSLHMEVL